MPACGERRCWLDGTAALSLIFIGGNIERVADLATNIGEDVVYLVEGKTIRHRVSRRSRIRTAVVVVSQPAASWRPAVSLWRAER